MLNASPKAKNKTTAQLLIATSCIIWGIQPMMVKFVIRELDPVPLVSIRYFIVSLALFTVLFFRGEKILPPRSTWATLAVLGLLGVCINNVTQFIGLKFSTVSNFTIIATLNPTVTAFLSYLLLRERLHCIQWLGIASSLCGALYLLSNGSLQAILSLSFNQGDLLFFASQLAWALYSIVIMRIAGIISPFAIVAWSALFGSLALAAGGMATDTFTLPTSLSPLAAGAYLFVIFFGGFLAMVCWNEGTGIIGPSQAAIFMNMLPLIGVCCGVLFLDEIFYAAQCIGGFFILCGVYLATHHQAVADLIAKHFTKSSRN